MKYLPIILILICSCSVQEQFDKPHHEDYMVVGVERDIKTFLFFKADYAEVLIPKYNMLQRGEEGTTVYVRIADKEPMQCGDYLISEFRFN